MQEVSNQLDNQDHMLMYMTSLTSDLIWDGIQLTVVLPRATIIIMFSLYN